MTGWAVVGAGWLAVLLLTATAAAGAEPRGVGLYLPFALSIVLFGLPHGAVDHLVLLRLDNAPLRLWPLARVLATYLAIGLTYLACWFIAPVASFVFFIALTWFHWGQGDVHSLLALTGGRHLRSGWQRGLALVVRGGMPMLIPLLAFPDVYLDVAGSVVGAITDEPLTFQFSPLVRGATTFAFAGLCAVHVIAGWSASRRLGVQRDWAVDATETALLAVFFATVHPLLAVGVYFCLWHSVRHIARIVASPPAVPSLPSVRSWPSFFVQALPMTAIALAFLVGLYTLVPTTPSSLPDLVGLYLLLISTLTLPHVWVVARMDRAEGVWRSD
ncbi:MAG: beta-carotene 15,15'-dioxygenase, Brp/Blh family [Rhodothermaceae bacterium]|nr:beta-carotene 15,15'-dioxygenase, Brp/Blh family [Rhodothermaceae bacterium]